MHVAFTISTATVLHILGGAVASAGVSYLQHRFHFRLTKGEIATVAKVLEKADPQIAGAISVLAAAAEAGVVAHDPGTAPGLISL